MSADALARRLVVGLEGPGLTATERAWLTAHRPAGVILFSRNCKSYSQLHALCAELHDLVPGLEIVADHEGGPVSQLAAALGRPPVAWGLGLLDDVPLTARVHAVTGRRLRSAGIDRVLAPVADVLVEGRNPVIGSRAFGANEDRVTRHVVAAVTGLKEAGIAVCLKHWPGHGASRVDTHVGTAAAAGGTLPGPFAAGLHAGADAVMAGHVTTPAGLPATLDGQHLREAAARLGAGGREPTWWADDLTMGALRPAMAAAGSPALDGRHDGLVEPESVPRAWFAAAAAAGCERLLVRGLPLAAFPCAEAPAATGPGGVPDAVEPAWRGGPYREARTRLWALAGTGFAAPDRDLLWWDRTRGDRWQIAGGDRGEVRDLLGPLLAARFGRVVGEDGAEGPTSGCTRLLVTSHRPLAPLGPRDPRLADGGRCLVLGHPSLAGDLTAYLGAGWRVGALPDIAPEDLFIGPEAGPDDRSGDETKI